MTNNFCVTGVFGVYFFGDHEGCPDDWTNMHDEELVALFETKEMAEEYIIGMALWKHLVYEVSDDKKCYRVIGHTSDVEAMSELQKEANNAEDHPYYDDYGWKIRYHKLYRSANLA